MSIKYPVAVRAAVDDSTTESQEGNHADNSRDDDGAVVTRVGNMLNVLYARCVGPL